MKHFLATFSLLCVCLSPSSAEISDTQRVTLENQARKDAETEGDEKFWALETTFAGTTLVSPSLSLPALAGATFYPPAPPAYRFRGKSPVAVEIYTHTYKSVYRRTALRGVRIGALGGSTLYDLTRRGYGFTFVRSW